VAEVLFWLILVFTYNLIEVATPDIWQLWLDFVQATLGQ
jgi:hypothetical protein